MDKIDNKYKTKLCNYFDKYGKCDNNYNCKFAHGEEELRCLFDKECVNEKCKRIHLNRDKDNEKSLLKDNNTDNTRNIDNKNIPIQLNINGIDVDDSDNIKENKIEIINLINNMEIVFEKYNENIKQSINDKIKNNHLKYTLLNNLNEIKMEIELFKNNYKDVTKTEPI